MSIFSSASVRRKTIPVFIVLAIYLAAALFATFFDSALITRITTVMFINLIVVLALQMFMGNSGILSFAHVGFMGIGAYASAILSIPADQKAMALPSLYGPLVDIQLGFMPAMVIGAGVAALFAAIAGYPLMRLSDTAAAIATFALLVIVHVVLSQWTAMTNGPRTLFGLLQYTDLWTAATWGFVIIIAAFLFKESSLGMKLRASRDNVHAADAIGIDVVRARWVAFIISAFIAGMSGALWAHFITSFKPDAFYLAMTFIVLTMIIVGGPQTVTGSAIGVLIVTVVTEGLRLTENELSLSGVLPFEVVGMTEILLAIVLILMLAFKPGGLVARTELGSGRRRVGRHDPSTVTEPAAS